MKTGERRIIEESETIYEFEHEKNDKHCAFCLKKQGHVCYECCEDRHRLVKMELQELKAKVHTLEQIIKVKFGVKINVSNSH